ncbi:MAG: hypothetical protein ACAH80_03315 [Alphaproteobacteria bacterium]
MIFTFIEDGTLDIIKDIAEARRNYEGIDVESGVYTFYDAKGVYLRPHFTTPNKHGKCLWLISWSSSGIYELVADASVPHDPIALALQETQALNPNPYFKTLDEVKAYFSNFKG